MPKAPADALLRPAEPASYEAGPGGAGATAWPASNRASCRWTRCWRATSAARALLAFCRHRLDAVQEQIKVLDDGQLQPWNAGMTRIANDFLDAR